MVINASPRKQWNTGQMMSSVRDGAVSAGAETEYVNLYDLDFKGCRGCLACKRKNAEKCKCYWNDDLSPLIEKILSADAVFIGSPIYLAQPDSMFHALYERLKFCILSYEGGFYFKGKVNVGLVFTMNVTEEFCRENYADMLKRVEEGFAPLNGTVKTVCACDTLQVKKYENYAITVFDPDEKKKHRDEHFQKDLDAAKALGAELCEP